MEACEQKSELSLSWSSFWFMRGVVTQQCNTAPSQAPGEHNSWAEGNVLMVGCGFQAGDPELAACPTTLEEEATRLTILILGEVVDITAHCK